MTLDEELLLWLGDEPPEVRAADAETPPAKRSGRSSPDDVRYVSRPMVQQTD